MSSGAPAFLIVDDNEPLRNIIVRVIRKAAPHAVIHEAALVRDALQALSTTPYSALVIDYRLPDGDGADVLRWVRARALPLPIIAISGLNVDREMEAIGADYILNKPFHIDRLLTIIRTILEETRTGMTITLLGLGTHALTNEARDLLAAAQHVYVLARSYPATEILSHLAAESFDAVYDDADDWNALPHTIAAAVIEQAAGGQDLLLAVPGHPLVGNMVVQQVRKLARQQQIDVRVAGGASLVDEVCVLLDADEAAGGLQVIDALALLQNPDFPAAADGTQRPWSEIQGVGLYTPPVVPFPLQPTQPALVCNLHRRMLPLLIERLCSRYPHAHMVHIVSAGDAGLQLEPRSLDELADNFSDHVVGLYVPPLAVYDDVHAVQSLNWVTARLLGPAGCPWDREQTHRSLRRYLLEETHETLEALDAEDWDGLSEELGDLLLQIVLHSEMARQAGHFAWGDVTAHVTQKLIRRHPHVFGELAVSGSGDVLRNWEAIKAQEHAAKGTTRKSLLDGVPVALPALAAAQQIGEKAAKVGFDWPDVEGVWAKVAEELDEIRAASPDQRSEEFGDLLFVLARGASWLGVDVEASLREANAKFRRRFAACERLANGRSLKSLTPDELDALWNAAKGEERQGV